MNGIQSDGYLGQMDPTTASTLFNALSFLVTQVMEGNWTVTLGQVKSVSGGGIVGPAIVGVQPMVSEIDGYGNVTPHDVINNIPAFRLQGGTGGVVADPIIDDIGILAFASRDISSVIANKAPSTPGSLRTFDPADGMFIGGFLGGELTQYLSFTESGVEFADKNGNSMIFGTSGVNITDKNGNQIQTGVGFVNIITTSFRVNGVPVTVP
jgi:hypothetical protein